MEAMGSPVVSTADTGVNSLIADGPIGDPMTADAAALTVSATTLVPSGPDMAMAGWCIAVLMLGLGATSMLLRCKSVSLAPRALGLPNDTSPRSGGVTRHRQDACRFNAAEGSAARTACRWPVPRIALH